MHFIRQIANAADLALDLLCPRPTIKHPKIFRNARPLYDAEMSKHFDRNPDFRGVHVPDHSSGLRIKNLHRANMASRNQNAPKPWKNAPSDLSSALQFLCISINIACDHTKLDPWPFEDGTREKLWLHGGISCIIDSNSGLRSSQVLERNGHVLYSITFSSAVFP